MTVQAPRTATGVFDRVLCGVDGTPESLEAARQAARLRSLDGTLDLVGVTDINVAVHAGYAMGHVQEQLEAEIRQGLARGVNEVKPTNALLLAGAVVPSLLEEAQETGATAARGGHGFEIEPIQALTPYFVVDPGHPVEVLTELSADADLVVLGSRGLHGLRALGSISERVAHTGRLLCPRRPKPKGGIMTTTISESEIASYTQATIFRRILVGIDDSPESLEAARQAAVLATGPVTLLAAYDVTPLITGAGMAPVPPMQLDETPLREAAEQALEAAKNEFGSIETTEKIVKGRAWQELHYEIARKNNTLVAVGSHGAARAKGILIGSTATELLHEAPCSVLVARNPLKAFPSSIVVGVDDSPHATPADAVARDLAERFDAELKRCENVRHPVEFLVEASREADLLVVGSRGLKGIKALGSVSERVAHEAKCSVLVLR